MMCLLSAQSSLWHCAVQSYRKQTVRPPSLFGMSASENDAEALRASPCNELKRNHLVVFPGSNPSSFRLSVSFMYGKETGNTDFPVYREHRIWVSALPRRQTQRAVRGPELHNVSMRCSPGSPDKISRDCGSEEHKWM